MKTMRQSIGYFALPLAFAVMFLLCSNIKVKAAGTGTVTVDVEKFSIGQGYLIEPEQITFQDGETFAQVFDRFIKKHGYTYTHDGTLTSSFYLRSIDNADTGKLNIPLCVQAMPSYEYGGETVSPPTNINNTGNIEFPTLGEFAYSRQSGWMYFVNNNAPNVGFSEWKVKNGEVIRVQFTVYGLGADLGAKYGEDSVALSLPDRNEATKKMAIMNNYPICFENDVWKAAYNKAKSVISDFDSSVSDVLSATKTLPSEQEIIKWISDKQKAEEAAQKAALVKKYTPAKTTLKSVKKTGTKKAKLNWKKVKAASGYEIYMSTKKSSGYKKIKTIKKAKTVTFTKSGLKKKKTYYFKVRTYRTANGVTYYGNYSNVKKVKIK